MPKAKRAIMVAVLATAMCADRAGMAAPTIAPRLASAARSVMGRMAGSFRNAVVTVQLDHARRLDRPVARRPQAAPPVVVSSHPAQLSICQLRLPPPFLT